MRKNKAALATATCLLAFGMTWGATSLRAMVNTYSGACGPLEGIPGLLQKAGFVPLGRCGTPVDGRCRISECLTTAGRRGHCVVEKVGKVSTCVCKREVTSH